MDILVRIIREPAALIGLITLALAGGSIFGLFDLNKEQAEWIIAIVGAAVLVLRSYVTPVGDPNLPIGTVVNANSSQPTGIVVERSDG